MVESPACSSRSQPLRVLEHVFDATRRGLFVEDGLRVVTSREDRTDAPEQEVQRRKVLTRRAHPTRAPPGALLITTANTSTGGNPLSAQCLCARASAELTQSSANFSGSSTVSFG
jgi:hypothetical protein